MVVLAHPQEEYIQLKVSLFGKNLATPLVERLVIRINDKENETSEQSPPAYPEGRADAPSESAEAQRWVTEIKRIR